MFALILGWLVHHCRFKLVVFYWWLSLNTVYKKSCFHWHQMGNLATSVFLLSLYKLKFLYSLWDMQEMVGFLVDQYCLIVCVKSPSHRKRSVSPLNLSHPNIFISFLFTDKSVTIVHHRFCHHKWRFIELSYHFRLTKCHWRKLWRKLLVNRINKIRIYYP